MRFLSPLRCVRKENSQAIKAKKVNEIPHSTSLRSEGLLQHRERVENGGFASISSPLHPMFPGHFDRREKSAHYVCLEIPHSTSLRSEGRLTIKRGGGNFGDFFAKIPATLTPNDALSFRPQGKNLIIWFSA